MLRVLHNNRKYTKSTNRKGLIYTIKEVLRTRNEWNDGENWTDEREKREEKKVRKRERENGGVEEKWCVFVDNKLFICLFLKWICNCRSWYVRVNNKQPQWAGPRRHNSDVSSRIRPLLVSFDPPPVGPLFTFSPSIFRNLEGGKKKTWCLFQSR